MLREADTRSFRALRRVYGSLRGWLDTDSDVAVEPVHLGFSLCFRHDMDRFDAAGFAAFRQADADLPPSTLFFLEDQWRRFPDAVRQAAASGRYECALHSEAKPMPVCWSVHQLSRWLERGYARRLRRQARRFGRAVGRTAGHAAHAVNNYLPFQSWMNWNIIENASLRAGFDYVSDWRLPSRVAEGEPFPPPWPAYRRRRGGWWLLVLPTSWDDKFFFYSYEDHHARRLAPAQVAYRSDRLEEAFASALAQAEHCRRLETPFVVNIHPWHSVVNGQAQFLTLKRRLAAWAAAHCVPVRTCGDYVRDLS